MYEVGSTPHVQASSRRARRSQAPCQIQHRSVWPSMSTSTPTASVVHRRTRTVARTSTSPKRSHASPQSGCRSGAMETTRAWRRSCSAESVRSGPCLLAASRARSSARCAEMTATSQYSKWWGWGAYCWWRPPRSGGGLHQRLSVSGGCVPLVPSFASVPPHRSGLRGVVVPG